MNARLPSGSKSSFFFHPVHSTLSCPICWYNCAWNASWSRSRWSRRAEKMSGISLRRRCFQWAICVGCTPWALAHSLTVLTPFKASNATRAVNSALECFRCVDICVLLLDLILTQHSLLITCPVFGVHYKVPIFLCVFQQKTPSQCVRMGEIFVVKNE